MDKLATFLAMGGRAAFVWPAYGLTALVLIAVLVVTLRTLRARSRELERLERPRPRRSR